MHRQEKSNERYKNRIRYLKEATFDTLFHVKTGLVGVSLAAFITFIIYYFFKTIEAPIKPHIYLSFFVCFAVLVYSALYLRDLIKIKKTVKQWQRDEDCEDV